MLYNIYIYVTIINILSIYVVKIKLLQAFLVAIGVEHIKTCWRANIKRLLYKVSYRVAKHCAL